MENLDDIDRIAKVFIYNDPQMFFDGNLHLNVEFSPEQSESSDDENNEKRDEIKGLFKKTIHKNVAEISPLGGRR